MAATTRVYSATINGVTRFVRASHPSHVVSHLAREFIAVRVATQDDLIKGLQAGQKVETLVQEQGDLLAGDGGN